MNFLDVTIFNKGVDPNKGDDAEVGTNVIKQKRSVVRGPNESRVEEARGQRKKARDGTS